MFDTASSFSTEEELILMALSLNAWSDSGDLRGTSLSAVEELLTFSLNSSLFSSLFSLAAGSFIAALTSMPESVSWVLFGTELSFKFWLLSSLTLESISSFVSLSASASSASVSPDGSETTNLFVFPTFYNTKNKEYEKHNTVCV